MNEKAADSLPEQTVLRGRRRRGAVTSDDVTSLSTTVSEAHGDGSAIRRELCLLMSACVSPRANCFIGAYEAPADAAVFNNIITFIPL